MQLITINHLKLSFKLKVGGANLVFSTVVSLFVQMEIFLGPGLTDALCSLESLSYDSTFPIYHF